MMPQSAILPIYSPLNWSILTILHRYLIPIIANSFRNLQKKQLACNLTLVLPIHCRILVFSYCFIFLFCIEIELWINYKVISAQGPLLMRVHACEIQFV